MDDIKIATKGTWGNKGSTYGICKCQAIFLGHVMKTENLKLVIKLRTKAARKNMGRTKGVERGTHALKTASDQNTWNMMIAYVC